jgi:acetylglutamate/LysW-gamma-L-alpha-aminoadipate kinase
MSGTALNVDADRVAARLAVALHATDLIVLSNVPGLLRDRTDPASLVRVVRRERARDYLRFAEDRMRVKLRAAIDAADGGVQHVRLAGAAGPYPVSAACAGGGTLVSPPVSCPS